VAYGPLSQNKLIDVGEDGVGVVECGPSGTAVEQDRTIVGFSQTGEVA